MATKISKDNKTVSNHPAVQQVLSLKSSAPTLVFADIDVDAEQGNIYDNNGREAGFWYTDKRGFLAIRIYGYITKEQALTYAESYMTRAFYYYANDDELSAEAVANQAHRWFRTAEKFSRNETEGYVLQGTF